MPARPLLVVLVVLGALLPHAPAQAQRGSTYEALAAAQEELKVVRGELRRQRLEQQAVRKELDALRTAHETLLRDQGAADEAARERIAALEERNRWLAAGLAAAAALGVLALLLAVIARRSPVPAGRGALADQIHRAEARLRALEGEGQPPSHRGTG